MTTLVKAAFTIGIALASAALASVQPTFAQRSSLKATLFPPPGNPLVKAMDKWAEEMKAKSNGRLVIKVFSASQMGRPPRQFDLARTGVADIAMLLQGATPGGFPLTELAHIPGVAKSNFGSSLGLSEIAQEVLGPDYPGVKILNVLTMETVVVSRSEMTSVASLKGKRIRAAGSGGSA